MEVCGFKAVLLLSIITPLVRCYSYSPGYSFAKFRGPVSGPEQKIKVYDDGMYHQQHDFAAKPDYHFEYGVEDPSSKVRQSRQETRNGDAVQGEYSVLDPDGKYRTVRYTADKLNGFQAQIITNGKAAQHPQPEVQAVHPPPVYGHDDHSDKEYDSGGDGDENESGDDDDDDGDEDDDEYY